MAKKKLKRIPISAAKEIAKKYEYDQVVILARRTEESPEPHGNWIATYGRNKEHCDAAALVGQEWIGGLLEGKYKLRKVEGAGTAGL